MDNNIHKKIASTSIFGKQEIDFITKIIMRQYLKFTVMKENKDVSLKKYLEFGVFRLNAGRGSGNTRLCLHLLKKFENSLIFCKDSYSSENMKFLMKEEGINNNILNYGFFNKDPNFYGKFLFSNKIIIVDDSSSNTFNGDFYSNIYAICLKKPDFVILLG